MPRGSNVRESVSNIEAQLEAELRQNSREKARIREETREQADEVRDHARRISPVESGAYAAAWQVDPKLREVDGMPAFRVKNTDFKARWIEYGTGDPLPTPEFAVARKTAAKFGGTVDG